MAGTGVFYVANNHCVILTYRLLKAKIREENVPKLSERNDSGNVSHKTF